MIKLKKKSFQKVAPAAIPDVDQSQKTDGEIVFYNHSISPADDFVPCARKVGRFSIIANLKYMKLLAIALA